MSTVRLTKEYRDRYRNQEYIADLNGDWTVESEWIESTGEEWIKIRQGPQTRELPKRFTSPKRD